MHLGGERRNLLTYFFQRYLGNESSYHCTEGQYHKCMWDRIERKIVGSHRKSVDFQSEDLGQFFPAKDLEVPNLISNTLQVVWNQNKASNFPWSDICTPWCIIKMDEI